MFREPSLSQGHLKENSFEKKKKINLRTFTFY